jgi:predicted transcriptional regulator
MSGIIRKVKRGTYTLIANISLEDRSLDWDCKGMLCYLLSRPDGWQVDIDEIAKNFPLGGDRDRIQHILNSLESAAYITRLQEIDADGRFVSVLYVFDVNRIEHE